MNTNHKPGMFLWVRLVLSMLEVAGNIDEIQHVVKVFPTDLEKLYIKMLQRITQSAGSSNATKVIRILEWISFAKRPLKIHELQYGLVLHSENTRICAETKPFTNIHNICKPLVEDGLNDTVVFAHSSVKE